MLEHAISVLPESQMFYQTAQKRTLHEELVDGQLHFALEGRHAKIQNGAREILQFRLTPLVWRESSSENVLRRTVWYQKHRTSGWFNSFQLSVNHSEQIVRFGPSGNLLITDEELRGLGIGTFTWRMLIEWAKNKFPEYKVYRVELSRVDATSDNLERRNHFFQKHGFMPFFDNEDSKSGWFYCEKVSDLIESKTTPNWRSANSIETVANLLRDKTELQDKINLITRNTYSWSEDYGQLLVENKRYKKFSLAFLIVSLLSATLLIGLQFIK